MDLVGLATESLSPESAVAVVEQQLPEFSPFCEAVTRALLVEASLSDCRRLAAKPKVLGTGEVDSTDMVDDGIQDADTQRSRDGLGHLRSKAAGAEEVGDVCAAAGPV